MNDPRFRLATSLLLSIAAFSSVWGAFLVLGWWAVFTGRFRTLPRLHATAGFIIIIAVIAVLTEYFGGDGISYFVRLTAILAIASWAYSERQSGELLDVAVWLFGNRRGFDLGLVAEMGLQSLVLLQHDVTQIRNAFLLKGRYRGIRNILPLASGIIDLQLRRSQEQARILSIRGFRGGGTLCPDFTPSATDKYALLSAFFITISLIIHVRDVFILIQ